MDLRKKQLIINYLNSEQQNQLLGQLKQKKRVRKSYNRFKQEFYYPQKQFKSTFFQNLYQVKYYLIRQNPTQQKLKYLNIKHTQNIVQIQCNMCSMKIKMKRVGGILKVTSFNNRHLHKGRKHYEQQQKDVLQFIKTTNLDMDAEGSKNVLISKFKLSQRRFYYIKNKFTLNVTNFQQFKIFLTQKQFYFQYNKEQIVDPLLFPSYIVIVTPQMKKFYQKYGDCLRFDVTFNLIRHKDPQNKGWNVGIFSGFLSNLSPIIFGIAFLNIYDAETYEKIFRKFFLIANHIPQSIVTDQQVALGVGIQNLKEKQKLNYAHFLDRFHILNNVGKKLQNLQDLAIFSKLLVSKTEQEAIEGISKIKNIQFKGQKKKGIYNFVKKIFNCSHLFCEYKFYGLSITTSPAQKINDMIKAKIRYQSSFSKVVNLIEQLSLEQFSRQQMDKNHTDVDIKLVQSFQDESLLSLIQKIPAKPFNYFLKNYISSIKYKIEEMSNNIYRIYYQDKHEFVDSLIRVCSCGQHRKTGILCLHLIVFCKFKKINYLYLIKERWIQEQKVVKRGRRCNDKY